MIQFAPVASMLLVMAQSGGALVGQRPAGLSRICSYENPLRGRRAPLLTVAIGLGEPCPFQYPGRRRPRPAEIPSLATLDSESRSSDRTVCYYVYLGVRYSRQIPPARRCPLTPHFND